MNKILEMGESRITIEEREADTGELVQLASYMPPTAWMLMETPRELVFRRFDGKIEEALLNDATNLIIFSPDAELRMEKSRGSTRGSLRIIRNDPDGEQYTYRRVSALGRHTGMRVLYEEYFRPDTSGFLLRFCGRLHGVEEGKR